MNQASAKLQQGFIGVAVFPVLLHGMVGGLSCPWIFQLNGYNGNTVNEKYHVNGFERIGLGVVYLADNREDILCKEFCYFRINVIIGPTVQEGEMCVINAKAAFDNLEDTLFFDLSA